MSKNLLLFVRTIKYLHFRQIFFKIWYLLKNNNYQVKNYNFEIRKSNTIKKLIFLKKNKSILEINKFKFINLVFKIDNNWNIKTNNKLWIYNLNYFDYLNSNFDNTVYLNKLINRWINLDNRKKKYALDPYPTSLRIVNWIKYFISRDIKNKKFNTSLYNQVVFLSHNLEYHLLGNHYFSNLKALIYGCLYFDTIKTNKILSSVLLKFERELNNQILKDGGHAEFSPMYHAIILEDLLDIQSIINYYQYKIQHKLLKLISVKIKLMIKWLKLLTHPNNTYCKFNDTTDNIAQSYSSLESYIEKMRINYRKVNTKSNYLKDTGYFTYIDKKIFLSTNIGDSSIHHLSGHTHADTFSFELSYKDIIFFTNGGISTYKIGKKRDFERSSANHNTVIVENRNSSEVWKSFRLARRARLGNFKIYKSNNSIKISNYYTDYLKDYKHTRSIIINKNKISIFDNNHNNKNFISRMIVRPDIKIDIIDNNSILLSNKNTKIKVHSKIGIMNINKFKFKDKFESSKSTFSIDVTNIKNKSLSELIFL